MAAMPNQTAYWDRDPQAKVELDYEPHKNLEPARTGFSPKAGPAVDIFGVRRDAVGPCSARVTRGRAATRRRYRDYVREAANPADNRIP